MKRIVPLAESSMRAGEDLAAGHVALAVGVDPGAAVDAQPQVGALGLDPDLAAARAGRSTSALPGASLSSRHAATGSGRSRNSARVDERGVVVVAHPGLLGQRRRRPHRAAPALARRASWIGARARAARAIRAGSTPASARVLSGASM